MGDWLEPGDLVAGKYRLTRMVGQGGLGAVWAATDDRGRDVAIKVLLDADAEARQHLVREGRIQREFKHPNIVDVLDVGETESGLPFVVMELVEGQDFFSWIKRAVGITHGPDVASSAPARDLALSTTLSLAGFADDLEIDPVGVSSDVPLGAGFGAWAYREPWGGSFVPDETWASLRRSFAQLVEALHAVHETGHLHRDVKPSNIIVTEDDRVRLLDFGLVMALERPDQALMGTPAYMAPEQARGEPLTPAADLYAVGVMLYEVLTGRLPFAGSSVIELLRDKLHKKPPPVRALAPDAPPDLADLAMGLLAFAPAQRPTVEQCLAILRSSREEAATPARPPPSRVPAFEIEAPHDAPHHVEPAEDLALAAASPGAPAPTDAPRDVRLPPEPGPFPLLERLELLLPEPGPFPGPRPYRAEERRHFHGRDAEATKLVRRVLAHPCVTLFGPSGAGKSSLMQAAVIPALAEEHAYRVVCVQGWPIAEPPVPWLVRALFAELHLGVAPEDLDASGGALDALDEAMDLAARRSDRPILIYLDQLEQVLFPRRRAGEAQALIEAVDRLAREPSWGLRVVLSLREDYLGLFRDLARGRRELLEHGARLRPLTVAEMTKAAIRVAEEAGQSWYEAHVRRWMLEVRAPGHGETDEAEVEAAFGQIVCRVQWERQRLASAREVARSAEEILRDYVDEALERLGVARGAAQRLLEERLLDEEGNRTVLAEEEARGALPPDPAYAVLELLERASVLRAEVHDGSRTFEIAHDWLANRFFERKKVRAAEQKRRAEARRRG